MEYGDQVTFDLKTGKAIRTPVDDAWVIENTRLFSMVSDKTSISADGAELARVMVMLTTNWLVSAQEKRTVAEDATMVLIAEEQRYRVDLKAGMGVVAVKALAAGSYELRVDGGGEPLVIEATEALATPAEMLTEGRLESAETPETVIVLGARRLAAIAESKHEETLKELVSDEFKSKAPAAKVDRLTEIVIDLLLVQRGK